MTIAGRSVLDGTIRALRSVPVIGPIILALEGVDATDCLAAIDHPDGLDLAVAPTRPDRWQAIMAALEMAGPSELVILHDPNRPLVSATGITSLLRRSHEFEATLTAMPVHGTIKRVAGGRIVGTVARDALHAIQTPWVFRRADLAAAICTAIAEGWAARDELHLARMAGIRVHLAEGHHFNVSIASQADARFAELAKDQWAGSGPVRLPVST